MKLSVKRLVKKNTWNVFPFISHNDSALRT